MAHDDEPPVSSLSGDEATDPPDFASIFKVTQIEPASVDIAFRLFITPEALCFAHIGEAYSDEDLSLRYESIDPLSLAFIDADPRNFRLPTGDIRLVVERRPHLHNPLNSGSLHIWLAEPKADRSSSLCFTFLLDYTTNVDLLIEKLRPFYPALEVLEDPALKIETGNAQENWALRIMLQWQRGMGLLLLAFALGWIGLIASISIAQLAVTRMNNTSTSSFLAVLFLLGMLAVFLLAGLFLLYYALTHLVNTTTLTLRGRELSIRHGPLPWSPARRLTFPPRADIRLRTRRLEQWNRVPTLTNYVYDLNVWGESPDGPPQRVISLSRLPHAQRVRRALRQAL